MSNDNRYLNEFTAHYNLVIDPEDPRLHVASTKVGQPTSGKVHQIVQAMVGHANTMPNCVGLAAPQIGVNRRIIIVKHNSEWVPMINPRIVAHSPDKIWGPEGCLSHTGVQAEVARWSWVRVVSTDMHSGKEWRLVFAHSQPMAEASVYPQLYRVVQHEIDHIDGFLFTDLGADTRNYSVSIPGMEAQLDAHVKAEEVGPVEVDI
jgi:peptide deformylase